MKKHTILSPVWMFLLGAALGVLSKLMDINTQFLQIASSLNLANVFSEMSIWILFGTLISIYSTTKAKAALNVFVFCIGMLITYYVTAELTSSVYGMTFVYGWAAFSLCSPVFAWFTWMTKEKGVFPKIISIGILLVTLLVSIVMFSGPRVYDIAILIVLVYFLFIHKVKR